MPKVDVYDIKGKKVSDVELNENVFGIEPNETVVHSVLVNYLANQRQGTQSTKKTMETKRYRTCKTRKHTCSTMD